MENFLSPFEEKFWQDFVEDLVNTKKVRPWDPKWRILDNLRANFKKAKEKFDFLPEISHQENLYKKENVKRLLTEAKNLKGDRENPNRYSQSLEKTYMAILRLLSQRPLEGDEKFNFLIDALVLWDKNSGWRGFADKEPLSTPWIVACLFWINVHGLKKPKRAYKFISALSYGLRRRGNWAGAFECLQWALNQELEKDSRRNCVEAIAGLLVDIGEYHEARESYEESKKSNENLPINKDSKLHHDLTFAISDLKTAKFAQSEEKIKEVLKDLGSQSHVGFKLQILRKLVEFFILSNQRDKADQEIIEALNLLEKYPGAYANQRKRFRLLKDYQLAQKRLMGKFSKIKGPLSEILIAAMEELQKNHRYSSLLLIVTALETITLAMCLAKIKDIEEKPKLKKVWCQETKQKEEEFNFFSKDKKWNQFRRTPSLKSKNFILNELCAYSQEQKPNVEIYNWIKTVNDNRNRIFHGYLASGKLRFSTNRLDYLLEWYKNLEWLLTLAKHDIHLYYQNLL